MIEVSEPLPESKIGFSSVHNLLMDGKRIGYIDVGYIQKEDVKTFQRYTKRKLKAGQQYSMQLFIDTSSGVKAGTLGPEGLKEIVKAVKEKFAGLEDKDVFILELDAGKKKIVKRASEL
jgi:hypothetical protein